MSKSDIAVSVRDLSKSYTIAHNGERHVTLAESLLAKARRPFARVPKETFWALKDVSFDIQKGDVVGIIGRNGAGKSTLLKILSRITEPTSGVIDLYGRVGSLLEVGTGFHPELTGRENVFLNGAILGMTKAEIRKQFDAIVDFAGVSQFLDTPVKRYSSGMYVRLAFAVAAHLRSDILIVDEVLAVGDAEFQHKCLGKMKDAGSNGRTVLFVSHSMSAMRQLCRRAILLERGCLVIDSDINKTCERYLYSATERQAGEIGQSVSRHGSGDLRVTALRVRDLDGRVLNAAPSRQAFDIELKYDALCDLENITVSVDIDSIEGHRITTLYSAFLGEEFAVPKGEGKFMCRVTDLPIRPDKYRLNVYVGGRHGTLDFIRDAVTVEVASGEAPGVAKIPERAHGATVSHFSWRCG